MLNKKAVLIALCSCVAFGEVFANPSGTLTSYTKGDVLVCFRKSGGANDLVVDAGPISTFTNASPNQRINITQYTGTQLAPVGTNSILWSAFTWFDDSYSPTNIQWTLFVTKPRTSLNTQTVPWPVKNQNAQLLVGGDMGSIPPGAATIFNAGYNNHNTVSAVIEPDDSTNPNYTSGQSYEGTIGATGDFNGDLGDNIEKATPANFITANTVVRADFYQMVPSILLTPVTGGVKFLGYFELNTNGALSYVAYPVSAPTVPVIKSVGRTNSVSYISFTTGNSGTYTLRGTNSVGLSAARTNWPAITSVGGNGSVNTLQDTTSDSSKFYVITAQ